MTPATDTSSGPERTHAAPEARPIGSALQPSLTLDEVEADRNALRAEIQTHKRQLLVTSRRLESFEQLVRTIRNARAYRMWLRLGRWRGVEQTLEHLLGPAEWSGQVDADGDVLPNVEGLSHNIPKVLPSGVSFVAAFRVRNVGRTLVSMPAQHTLFWAGPSSGSRHAIGVTLDGQFLLHAQVPDDRIGPRASATLFFTLHPGETGDHRVQVFLGSSQAATEAREDRRVLFDVTYRVSSSTQALGVLARLKNQAFMFRFAAVPKLAIRFRCWRARLALRPTIEPDPRREHRRRERLRRLKDANKRLAFLEKQTRAQVVASRPCYLTVDSTVDCNLKCPLCYREDADAAKVLPAQPDMPDDVVDELIRTLLPTAYTISPSGWGEPLLSPHLDKLIDACSTYGVLMSFTTNGVLLNKKGLLDRLIPVLHWLEISIDSVNPALFEKLRAGSRFEQVMRNARAVGQIRSALPGPTFNFGFSMTLYHDNLHELPDMLRLVAECGGNFLKTDIGVIFNPRNLQHSVLRSPEAYNDVYARAQQCAKDLGLSLFLRSPFIDGDNSEANRYGVCDFLYTHASVATDGSYRPCYSSILPSRRASLNQDLLSLWNSPEMQRLRRDHDTPRGTESCKNCYMTLRGRDSLAKRKERFIRCGGANK